MSVAESLLSKIVDANDVPALDRFAIAREHFATDGERAAYDFIRKYAAENRGAAPSYATLVANCGEFTYIPDVSDSYEYLARALKETYAKREIRRLFADKDGQLADNFAKMTPDDFFAWMTDRFTDIRDRSQVRKSVGIDIARQADQFLTEYEARKAGKSSRIWRSKFPSVNKAIGGGYYSSNMYVFCARSGRGKSIITMEEAIEFAFQGATALVWALEMGWFEWMARAYSSISARQGLVKATIEGVDYDAGFENQALQAARLSAEFEGAFREFVARLNEILPGKIILRATNDEDFRDRSLRALEADILEVGADVVVIDPFYYLDYERNTSKTTGGDAAATSKKLRLMTGRLDVVTIAITQADEDESEKGEDGVRELRAPKRAEIKKTKQLLEDAAVTFGIDTVANDGRGMIELGKGRNGGEDTRIELLYLPNYGIVREPATEDVAKKFVSSF